MRQFAVSGSHDVGRCECTAPAGSGQSAKHARFVRNPRHCLIADAISRQCVTMPVLWGLRAFAVHMARKVLWNRTGTTHRDRGHCHSLRTESGNIRRCWLPIALSQPPLPGDRRQLNRALAVGPRYCHQLRNNSTLVRQNWRRLCTLDKALVQIGGLYEIVVI